MAASPVLVDSSFYIDGFRRGLDLRRELLRIAELRPLAVCGAIQCEVGRGIRNIHAKALIHNFWSTTIYIPTDNRLWTATEELLWNLDRKGIIIPVIDALIAASALRINAVVLTLDTHFQKIPGLIAVDRIV
jgi:predicted nucleic acid-binding protein